MALDKKNVALPFSTGIDTFTDPLQVMPTNLLDLQNAVFTKDKRLTKRNGYQYLTSLPADSETTTLTTFKNSLVAIGNSIQAFNDSDAKWVDHGRYQPVQLSVLPLSRSSGSQTKQDSASSGTLACTVYYDSSTAEYMYQINNNVNGQLIIVPTLLEAGADLARVVVLGNYFVVTYLVDVLADTHLRYIAIPVSNVENPGSPVDISTDVSSIAAGYDVLSANNYLYLGWNGSDIGGAIRAALYDVNLVPQVSYVSSLGPNADLMSLSGDASNIYLSYYDSGATETSLIVFSPLLAQTLAPTVIDAVSEVVELTSAVLSPGIVIVYQQVENTYSFSSVRSDYIQGIEVTAAGSASAAELVARSVGLASKAFIVGSTHYMLATYGGSYQPSYFLIDNMGNVVAKVAYSNGGGYGTSQVLPSVMVDGSIASVSYLFKTTLTPVNKTQGVATVAGIYSQLGVNLAKLDLSSVSLATAEIGNNLHIAGGFLWMYDGDQSSEHNFHLWPEDFELTAATTMGGNMSGGTYFYQITYEWTDAQGNIHRSAPGIPTQVVLTAENSVVLDIPTLRLTYKPNVRIVIYRWSLVQQAYYQVTSITSPFLNNPAVDSVQYTDLLDDGMILGNQLIYTTGGVVENIAYPAVSSIGLFKNRLVAIDSEDPDLLWYSKQVIQTVPVEPSDLFTLYVAPTISSQGSTGSTRVLSAMDDKLICFKQNAIYYISGTGPDNTGSQNDFSEPVFVTSTVGCNNIHGTVFSPNGILFQSDKGIWILGRDLSTNYIGAPAQNFNDFAVTSSLGIPASNQVRFTLDNGKALMYDYFFDRWATFTQLPAISSCLYQNMHTYLDRFGQVLQEQANFYKDGTRPTTIKFETAWFNLMGLQGFERAYRLYILGNFLSPHKLQVDIYYDYELSPSQSVLINPSNYYATFGVLPAFYGQGNYAGPGSLELWRIFLKKQKIQAFKVIVTEIFDAQFSTDPGAGLTLSGLNLVIGGKSGYTPLPSSNSIG